MVSLEFSIDINPSGRAMVLGLTQLLTEMSTRNVSWGGGGGRGGLCVGLTTLPPSRACLNVQELSRPACPGLYRNCFVFTMRLFCVLYCTTFRYEIDPAKLPDPPWLCAL